jgi:hypothetical protein
MQADMDTKKEQEYCTGKTTLMGYVINIKRLAYSGVADAREQIALMCQK